MIERLAALDFETTGTDPWTCRPVTIALVSHNEGMAPANYIVQVLNTGADIPIEASIVHGFTKERCEAEGLPVRDVMGEAAQLVAILARDRIPLCIMNARFDWPLFITELERLGLPVPNMPMILDPGVLDRGLDKYRRGKRTLTDLCQYYGVALEAAHTAAADAYATIALIRAMWARYPFLALRTEMELTRFQQSASENFISFLNQRKPEGEKIPLGWPVPAREATNG